MNTAKVGRLRPQLGVWQVLALSIGLMAPSMAININPQLAAPSIGRAVPVAFALATVGAVLVAWSFARLTQRFHTSGSVYGFVGATLGPRAGAVAGWALVGTYTALGVTTALTAGIFGTTLLSDLGWWTHQPGWAPYLVAAAVLLAAWPLAAIPIRGSTRLLLVCEGMTLMLIVAVSAAVAIRLATGHGPAGQHLSWDVVRIPRRTTTSSIALAGVFGFLSFVGFEASATLGEESRRPRRDIPRAIVGTVLVGGVFYTLVSAIEVLGFGTSPAQIGAFTSTPSLLGHLGQQYLSAWVGDLVTLGTVISALSCVAASTVGASRLIFALARDASPTAAPLAQLSPRWGTPTRAVTVVVVATGVIAAVLRFVIAASPLDGLSWCAEVATLIVLVAYLGSCLGTLRLMLTGVNRESRRWEALVPAGAIVTLGYLLWRNVVPWPTGAGRWLPAVSGAWILIGIVAVVAAPAMARRIGSGLAAHEGLAPL